MVIALFIALFVGVAGYLIYSKIKRRGASWVGTVIDKNVSETASNGSMHNNNDNNFDISLGGGNRNAVNRDYSLRIKSDDGNEFNWPVGEGFYGSVNVGDKLSKSPGTETPTKIQ